MSWFRRRPKLTIVDEIPAHMKPDGQIYKVFVDADGCYWWVNAEGNRKLRLDDAKVKHALELIAYVKEHYNAAPVSVEEAHERVRSTARGT